ncbi:alpha-galactosidase [Mangrovibacillus cuniculi]|uniref:Alpha-galactosidase n=1 Tax=Mangrovibacillus cuniculi TaxID=2593652 RepID=A0A7S8C8W2_9BACI|nr:alpha-galactosidase [Mangrovibacillus cuniculi]QPC45541.1 alpha-galactosidase [Mangrovibacillus cuniculi]
MIFVNEEKKQFHLQNKTASYIFQVMQNGQLAHLYYGEKIRHREDFSHLFQLPTEPLGNACFPYEGDPFFSLEFVKQEAPSYGTTDYREPFVDIESADGSRYTNFTFQSYKVQKGKPSLPDMPATYVENEDEAETLTITLKDEQKQTELTLSYTVFEQLGVITRNASVRNTGVVPLQVHRLLSASVDLPSKEYDWITLDGAWIRERHISCNRLRKGVQMIDSKKGTSSSWHNPFMALKKPETTEHTGEVYGFNLVYSGNFYAGVEVDTYDTSRAMIGINPFHFSWKLEREETFTAPEAVMVYSKDGLNGMSHEFHELYRTRLARGPWRDKDRPILINNWEATYFTFDEEKILDIATDAKEVGVELFVLDDGWFEGRNDDTTSLGDWVADRKKLPNGIPHLGEKVVEQGISFGLWFEPEMISKKSKLYEQHPDWVLGHKAHHLSNGRNQFVLDLTKQEVQDYLYDTLSGIFDTAPISYVKWDMNRNFTEAGTDSVSADQQGEVYHRYVLGLYRLLEKLTTNYPHILFESCASGGNRFDPGMLYYMPQTWTSDNTDAVERLKIQYGTSLVYPLSTMGAHVSDVPNHQTGRITSLSTRFHVAMFGVFGYELDVTKMSEEEKAVVKEQIAFYQANRALLQRGTFHRLLSPFTSNDTAWMVVNEEKTESVVAFYRTLAQPNPSLQRVKLAGLDPAKKYEVEGTEQVYYGDELMNVGLLLSPIYNGTVHTNKTTMVGDYASTIWKLKEWT